ncbi:MAG: hypothetical protein AB7E05_09185 [Sphingobium sp.]
MTDWTHPRITNPACRLNRFNEIATEARAAFNRRKDTYPMLVSAGTLAPGDARDDLEAWRAIAKEWAFVTSGDGEMARRITLPARILALDTAISRWFHMIDQSGGPLDHELEQCALLCAMRIWVEREADYYAGGNLIWSRGHMRGLIPIPPTPAHPKIRKAA